MTVFRTQDNKELVRYKIRSTSFPNAKMEIHEEWLSPTEINDLLDKNIKVWSPKFCKNDVDALYDKGIILKQK